MSNLHHLHRPFKQSPWIDNLSRELIHSGRLMAYINQGVRGLTSNPTIMEKAITTSSLYDEQIKRLAYEGLDVEAIYWRLVIDDIKSATDAFMPLWRESRGEDGYVSLEVSPALAHDSEKTLEQARYLWEEVNSPNLMIKIPATDECIPIIETLLSEGINVNVTLIFSLIDYKKVAQAHVSSHKNGSINEARSVASFFISRVDSLVDTKLEEIGTPEALALQGKTAVSQALLAYDIFLDFFAKAAVTNSDGSAIQRLLWASTSTKNPDYDELIYVSKLVAPLTVNTLPEETIDIILDRLPRDTASIKLEDIDDSLQTIESLRKIGIDMNEISDQLEKEGLKKFYDSYISLLAAIENKRN